MRIHIQTVRPSANPLRSSHEVTKQIQSSQILFSAVIRSHLAALISRLRQSTIHRKNVRCEDPCISSYKLRDLSTEHRFSDFSGFHFGLI